MQPRYEHDCDRCTFIGRNNAGDLYVCNIGRKPEGASCIVRRSDDPPDYCCVPEYYIRRDPDFHIGYSQHIEYLDTIETIEHYDNLLRDPDNP